MVYFPIFLVAKLVNSSVIFMLLQSWHQELAHPQHATFLSTGCNLDLTLYFFILLVLLSDTIGEGEKTFELLYHYIKKEIILQSIIQVI